MSVVELQEKTIKSWLELVSGLDPQVVFLGNQSGPRPDANFISFTEIASEASDYAEIFLEPPEPNPTLVQNEIFAVRTRITYQIDIWAQNGRELHDRLWASRYMRQVRRLMKIGAITINARTPIRNLTGLGDTKFLPRFSADFTFLGEGGVDTEANLGLLNELWDEFEIDGKFLQWDETP